MEESSNSYLFNCKLSIYFLNRRIDLITCEDLMHGINEACKLSNRKRIVISHYNIHAFNWSIQLFDFLKFQDNADISLCDGMGIIKALSFWGIDIPIENKVSLTRFIPELLKNCALEDLSVFLLGSTSNNLEKAIKNQLRKYPQLKLDGHHGFFNNKSTLENKLVIDRINEFKSDILIVGMGMPRQELWIHENKAKINSKIIIPCGAVMNRLSGSVPTPPKWISNAGLEWLFRLVQEPKRLASRYLIGNILFLFQILWAYHFKLEKQDLIRFDCKVQYLNKDREATTET